MCLSTMLVFPTFDSANPFLAIASVERKVSVDGIELTWATNVLSYYWLIEELLPVLKVTLFILTSLVMISTF